MLLQGLAEAVVRRRRIRERLEEPRRVLAGERDSLVTVNGLLCVLQRAGHDKGAEGLTFDRGRLLNAPLRRFAEPQIDALASDRVGLSHDTLSFRDGSVRRFGASCKVASLH